MEIILYIKMLMGGNLGDVYINIMCYIVCERNSEVYMKVILIIVGCLNGNIEKVFI